MMTGFDEWVRIKAGEYVSKNGLMKIKRTESGWNIYERDSRRGFVRIWTGCPTFKTAKAIADNL